MADVLQRMFPPLRDKLYSEQKELGGSSLLKEPIIGTNMLCKGSRVIVNGPVRSENTALLFQCAVSFAMDGHTVLFVTQEKLMSLPIAVEGSQKPDPQLMKQIHIKYFSNRSSLLMELSKIHSANPPIDIIIVDNLDFFASNPKTNSIGQVTASLCAHLIDAATYISSKRIKAGDHSDGSTCVLASLTTSAPCQDVYQKFFPTTFTVIVTKLALPEKSYVKQMDALDLDDSRNLKQLQCWLSDEGLPQYVITMEICDVIRIMDLMKGSELDADWSQTSGSVT